MLLQIIPGSQQLINAAKGVQHGDGSGYSFAVLVLSIVIICCLIAIVFLYKNNVTLNKNYIDLATKAIKSYSEFSVIIESQTEKIESMQKSVADFDESQRNLIIQENNKLKLFTQNEIMQLKSMISSKQFKY